MLVMQRHHHRTFCTACAAPLNPESVACQQCGAHRLPDCSHGAAVNSTTSSDRNPILVRLLGVAPIVLLLAVAGGLFQRLSAEQECLASSYAAAASAAEA